MLPIFIIAILFILPTQSVPNNLSNQDLSFPKDTRVSTMIQPMQHYGNTLQDLNTSASLVQTELIQQNRAEQPQPISESTLFQFTWQSQLVQNANINLSVENILLASFNGIRIDLRNKIQSNIEFDVVLNEGENILSLRVKNGYSKPAVRVFTITENKIQNDQNKINKQTTKNSLQIYSQNSQQIREEITELIQERVLQEGSFNGNDEGSNIDNNSSPPEPAQQNNTTPVTPQTPSEPASTSKSSNTDSSIAIIVVAISVPIATITIIAVTCMVLKKAPQPEQTDCAVTTSQTNVGTTADSVGTDPNQVMHPIQENVERHPQLNGF